MGDSRSMPTKSNFASELLAAQRQTLLELVRSNPSISLADLVAQDVPGIGEITVGELVDGKAAAGARRRGGRGRPAAAGRAGRTGGGRAKALNLRSEDERNAYDNAVMAALKRQGGEARAEAIRAEVGGTSAQLRASLERWMAEKGIKKKGHRRATVYRVA